MHMMKYALSGGALMLLLTACGGDEPSLSGTWGFSKKSLSFTESGTFQAVDDTYFTNTISGTFSKKDDVISFVWGSERNTNCPYSMSDDGKQLEITQSCRLRSFEFKGIYTRT